MPAPIETAQSRPGELEVHKTSSSNLFVGLPDVGAAGTIAGITRDAKGRVVSIDPSEFVLGEKGAKGDTGVGLKGDTGPAGIGADETLLWLAL